MRQIPFNKYTEIIEVLPIFCVDVVAQNARGEYLLIKRANEPKKDEWWVIGGRVLKGETLEDAAIRKVKEETSLQVRDIRPIGYFELLNGANPFGLSFEYHAVSIVFKAVIDGCQAVKLDNQSIGFKFTKELPADFYIKPFEVKQHCCKGDDKL